MFAQYYVQTEIDFFIEGKQTFKIFFQNYSFCTVRFAEMTMGKRF